MCVYNNPAVLNEALARSLKNQTVPHELIALDNSGRRFSSAAQALNYGGRQASRNCTHIMFAHQDILFTSPEWLEDVLRMASSLPELGVAGVAGNSREANNLFSNIVHGIPPRIAGKRISGPTGAMTVDECCAIVPRAVFQRHQFDEYVCDDWHLYMVEYCLRVKSQGLGIYVLPVEMHHLSLGSLGWPYFKALKKVLRVHGSAFPTIYTACGPWRADRPVYLQGYWWLAKEKFYGFTRRLLSSGLIPLWMQRKKRKRLRMEAACQSCPKDRAGEE